MRTAAQFEFDFAATASATIITAALALIVLRCIVLFVSAYVCVCCTLLQIFMEAGPLSLAATPRGLGLCGGCAMAGCAIFISSASLSDAYLHFAQADTAQAAITVGDQVDTAQAALMAGDGAVAGHRHRAKMGGGALVGSGSSAEAGGARAGSGSGSGARAETGGARAGAGAGGAGFGSSPAAPTEARPGLRLPTIAVCDCSFVSSGFGDSFDGESLGKIVL